MGQDIRLGNDRSELAEAVGRLLVADSSKQEPATLRAALVDLYEFWLYQTAEAAGVRATDQVALVAIGGLGRRELVPFSDLDLLLVHQGNSEIATIADRLWYPLWDAKVGLDHSVRTPAEITKVAAEDVRVTLGLLDLRYLSGNAALAEEVASAARTQWRQTARKRLPEMIELAQQRWLSCGEIAQSAEPDLKNARGGLRDFSLLNALALAQLTASPSVELLEAKRLLLDVRTELRRETRRGRDVLTAADADVVAEALGTNRFSLARKLSTTGRLVSYTMDSALRSIMDGYAFPAKHSPNGLLKRKMRRTPLADGVVLHGSQVTLAKNAAPARDSALLLRLAAAAARIDRPISAGTLTRLVETAPEPRAPWPEEVRTAFIELLGAGPGLIQVVETLDHSGLWGRLLPEWGAVRDLPPRSPVHAWTVDRHSLQACIQASALTTTVSRPDLLLLAALLHDIGKGREEDHSVVGAAISEQVAARMGFSEQDARLIGELVRHHLLLPHTATRRDINEEQTVHRVVSTVDADPSRLELLRALTEADSLATGPTMWSTWKASLVDDLVRNCQQLLAGRALSAPEILGTNQQVLHRVLGSGHPEIDLTNEDKVLTVRVGTPARSLLLKAVAGVLAVNSLQVHSAVLREQDGVELGVFTALPRFGSLPELSLVREQITRALAGTMDLTGRLAAKERDYPLEVFSRAEPKVAWFAEETTEPDAVVVEVRATDRPGLLSALVQAFERCAADIRWARVTTLGPTVIDAFAIAPRNGLQDQQWRLRVETEVVQAAAC